VWCRSGFCGPWIRSKRNCDVALSKKQLELYRRIRKLPVLAFDFETTGLDAWHGDWPFAIGLGDAKDVLYFEWPVDPWTRTTDFDADSEAFEVVRELLENPKTTKRGHYVKFDVRQADLGMGIKVAGPIQCTMHLAHICNTGEYSYSLDKLGKKYLGAGKGGLDELKKATIRCRRQAKKLGWMLAEDVEADYWMPRAFDPSNRLCEKYCVIDVQRCFQLGEVLLYGIEELGTQHIQALEEELWHETYAIESRGIRVDPAEVEKQIAFFRAEQERWHNVVLDAAWPGFNVNSPQQMQKLVYEKLKLPITKTTDKGQPSCDVDALIAHLKNPVIAALFHYRACNNALQNFFEKFDRLKSRDPLNPGGWCIHPDFQQLGPRTGRYSCRNPNFQNTANALTTRSPMPIQARTPFGPRPGRIWYHADYSQVEVRIFADVSGEPTMLKAIEDGEDIHTACTNRAWGGVDNPAAVKAAIHALELDGTGNGQNATINKLWKGWGLRTAQDLRKLSQDNQIELATDWMRGFDWDIVIAEKAVEKKTCRARAKMIVFAKVFGGGPNAVKDLLQCTYDEAAAFLAEYDRSMPGIQRYIKELSQEARRNGFIVNRFGRILQVDTDKPYKAVNYMVQGSAADLLKRSMVKCARFLRETGLDWNTVLTVHDELVFEALLEHARRSVLQEIQRLMEDHEGAFNVPVPVEIEKVVSSWNQKEKAIY